MNVYGSEFREGSSKSYANNAEVRAVMQYLEKITTQFAVDTQEIGVISPYRFQTQKLLEQLKASNIRDKQGITVDSVERFQGSERKIIIITTTRTTKLGFVGCDLVSEGCINGY